MVSALAEKIETRFDAAVKVQGAYRLLLPYLKGDSVELGRPASSYLWDLDTFEEQDLLCDTLVKELKSAEELKRFFRELFEDSDQYLDYLEKEGGVVKLRQHYYEVHRLDLEFKTKTAWYVSEETFIAAAENEAHLLAVSENAEHGVKHRPSLTSTVIETFNAASRILIKHGMAIEDSTLFDIGCGVGKPVLLANALFNFKRTVGIDYYQPVLDQAKTNAKAMDLTLGDGEGEVEFVFDDATRYRGFNGLNVVFMYNPFDEKIMRGLEERLRENAGKCILIYNKPSHSGVFTSHKGWAVEESHDSQDPDERYTIFSYGLNNG